MQVPGFLLPEVTMAENTNELYSVLDQRIEKDKEQLTGSVRSIIQIRSVVGEPEPGRPCGHGPAAALQAALDIAGGIVFSAGIVAIFTMTRGTG